MWQDITVAILGQLSLKMVRSKLMNERGGVHLDERHEPELSVLGLAPLVTLHQPVERLLMRWMSWSTMVVAVSLHYKSRGSHLASSCRHYAILGPISEGFLMAFTEA